MSEKIRFALGVFVYSLFFKRRKVKDPQKIKKIYIVKMDEIGDMVYAIPIFESLKNQFPQAKIYLRCKAFNIDLLKNNPFLDYVSTDVLKEKFDIVIHLRSEWKDFRSLILNFPKYYVERGSIRMKNKRNGKQKHELETNLEIIKPLVEQKHLVSTIKLYPQIINEIKVEEFFEKNQIKEPYIVFHTSSRVAEKCWPIDRFCALAEYFSKKGFSIIAVGAAFEVSEIKAFQNLCQAKVYNFAGVGTLLDFAVLVKGASLFIGNDSGPMHIASIQKVPLIGLFGPAADQVFYPLNRHAKVFHDSQHKVANIQLEDVLRAAKKLLSFD